MRITIRQLKSLIKEAVSPSSILMRLKPLKQQLFAELDYARIRGASEDVIFNIRNIRELSSFVSPNLIDRLQEKHPTSEIMMMLGEYEWTRNQ